MPQFRLELPEPKTAPRQIRILHTKNEYAEGIKIANWDQYRNSKPIDNNPYCAGKLNYFLSHYNRLGTCEDNNFVTTTGEMLKQVFLKDRMQPVIHMANYYTFDDTAECLEDYKPDCREVCNDFSTTMQHSYPPPKPYIMQKIAFQTISFMRNRKYKKEEPQLSPYKFYDESHGPETRDLIKHKASRWVSYNPGTGTYTETHEK